MNETCNTAYFLWLSELFYAGSNLPKRLYLTFDGDLKRIYETPGEYFSEVGCTEEECERLSNKDFSAANRILDYCAENCVTLLTYDSELYPERLFTIDTPPPVLYAKGQPHRLREGAAVTAVGSRACTEKGFRDAYTLSYKLACAGVTIVTGLAEGVDTACTLAALDAGGCAVGILGSGINVLYPFENTKLFDRMLRSGIVLTEFSPFTQPLARNFPVRNRVLAALCDVCLVGEARGGSGALITAKDAMMQGKKVYAVPGGIYEPHCEGTNSLLRSGALPVTKAEDILGELSYLYPESVKTKERAVRHIPDPPPRTEKAEKAERRRKNRKKTEENSEAALSSTLLQPTEEKAPKREIDPRVWNGRADEEKRILELLITEEKTANLLAKECGMDAGDVLTYLTLLEIDGLVESLPGGTYRLQA